MLALAGGCDDRPANAAETDPVQIRRSDANCLGAVEGRKDTYNLDGVGQEEIFLVLWCKGDPTSNLVEVIPGDADLATVHPTKLLVQIPGQTAGKARFCDRTATFRVTAGGKTQLYQTVWPKGAPAPLPLQPAKRQPTALRRAG